MEQPTPAPTDSTEISVPGPLKFIDLAAFRRIGGCGPLIRRDPTPPLATSAPRTTTAPADSATSGNLRPK